MTRRGWFSEVFSPCINSPGIKLPGFEPLVVRLWGVVWHDVRDILDSIERARPSSWNRWVRPQEANKASVSGCNLSIRGELILGMELSYSLEIRGDKVSIKFYGHHAGTSGKRKRGIRGKTEHEDQILQSEGFMISPEWIWKGKVLDSGRFDKDTRKFHHCLSFAEMMKRLQDALAVVLAEQTNIDRKSVDRLAARLVRLFDGAELGARRARVLLRVREPWQDWKNRKINAGRNMEDYIREVFADALEAKFTQRDFRAAYPKEFEALKTWCRRNDRRMHDILPSTYQHLEEAIAKFGVHSYSDSVGRAREDDSEENVGRAKVYEAVRRREWKRVRTKVTPRKE